MTAWTEELLVQRINRVRCGSCRQERAVTPGELENVTDVDEALDALHPACGCDDPIGYPLIRTESPLFEISQVDDNYRCRGAWEYDVAFELTEDLTGAGVLS